MLFDECIDSIAYGRFQMGKVEILLQLLTMFRLVVSTEELGIHLIQQGGWMLELAQDRSAIDIVQQVSIVLGLLRESSVIDNTLFSVRYIIYLAKQE
jgi:hypothetical protein